MSDRLRMLCDAAVAFVDEEWTDKGENDGVERTWIPTLNLTEDVQPVHVGRRLYVMPQINDPLEVTLIDRDDQERKYKFNMLMVERYMPAEETDPKSPPRQWVDDRSEWFVGRFNRLANQSTVLLDEMTPDREETAAIRVLVDRTMLDQHKTFWAWAEFAYAENTDLNGEVQL